MSCLSSNTEHKVKAILEGVRVRQCLKQAKLQFEDIVKEIQGPTCQLFWSKKDIYFSVKTPQQPIIEKPKPNNIINDNSQSMSNTKEQKHTTPQRQPAASKESRLRELRLKRDMYLNQLKIIDEKIREREHLRKSPFHL